MSDQPPYRIPRDLMGMDIGPAAKLVWAVLRDRQGRKATCWPSAASIAADCGMSLNTAKRAIAELVSAGLVTRSSRGDGRSCAYATHPAQNGLAHDGPAQDGPTQDGSDTGPILSYHPAQNEPQNHTQGTILREPHTVARPKRRDRREDAGVIYDAYPRHVGRAKAIAAIGRAIETIAQRPGIDDAAGWLGERVRCYAAAVSAWPEAERQYVPYPATWFAQGRYDDDESQWSRGATPATGGPSRVAAAAGKYAGIGIRC